MQTLIVMTVRTAVFVFAAGMIAGIVIASMLIG